MKKIVINLIKSSLYFFLGNNLHAQQAIQEGPFIQSDSIQIWTDHHNDLIKLKKDTTCRTCIDIVICSHGQGNYVHHLEIRDSTVNYYEYRLLADTLFLFSYNRKFIKTIDLNRLSKYKGSYQCLSTETVHHSYFKDVSIYIKGVLTSSILFDGVRYVNYKLP
jgi:hypothetical protein